MVNKNILNFLRHWIDVVAICYFFVVALLSNVLPEYVFERLANEHGLNYSVTTAKSDCKTTTHNNSTEQILHEVQKLAANFNIGSQLCMNLPSAAVSLFLGPLSDIIGRKPVVIWINLWLVLGCAFIFVVDFMKLHVSFLYVSLGCLGVGGSFYGLLMIAATYLSDICKDEKSRTTRFGILEGGFLLSTSVSMYSGGVFVREFGFRNMFYFTVVIAITGFIYSIFLEESYEKKEQNMTFCKFLYLPIKLFKIFLSGRNNMWRIWLLAICSNMLMFVAPAVLVSLLILTMVKKPYCFQTDEIGYFFGTLLLATGIGAVFATKVLTKCLQKSAVLVLTVISGITMTVCFGFATTTTTLYIGIPVGFLSLGQAPLSKAIACSFVSRTEFGSVMALFSTFQAIFTTIGFFIFQSLFVYFDEKSNSSNVYFAIAAISCLPFALILLNMLHELFFQNDTSMVYLDPMPSLEATLEDT